MGRSRGTRYARRRAPAWAPEPLHLPVEAPRPERRVPIAEDDADEPSDGRPDDRAGTHVIVIDLA
jgi:hypothetical protein